MVQALGRNGVALLNRVPLSRFASANRCRARVEPIREPQ